MPVVESLLGPSPSPADPWSRDGVWCIVVAAGSGRRFGGAKQFELIAGERVVDRSATVAASCCEGVVVVLPAEIVDTPAGRVEAATVVVPGGASRTESSRNGLAAVPESAEVVLVHDAARPLASPELFARVVASVRDGADAAVPVVPVVDTIRRTDGAVVDRDDLRAVQTPQAFRADALRSAYATGAEATDDAALLQSRGGRVVLVEGERRNLKLTGPDDLVVLRAFLEDDRRAAPVDRVGGPDGVAGDGGGDSDP